ncbi:MAG: uncharacterized membrane protein YkvA (DUF1232 family) [Salibacteraceae bacterium]|jgi:uncharacterized membrane protein YkvA (DUF1232 family)
MGLFGKKNRGKSSINEEYISEEAKKVTYEDVEKVVKQSSKIWSKLHTVKFDSYLEDGKIMLSLIKDFWKKDYTSIPWYALTAIVFSLLYVLNPMDLSPDFIPIVGYLDDVTVLSFALTLVKKDLSAYKTWKSKTDAIQD